MANSIGDDIAPDGTPIPDIPETFLAFRTWRLSDSGMLLSINPPSLTGKAGGSATSVHRKVGYIHRAFAADGGDGWPIGRALRASCGVQGPGAEANEDHGQIPAKECSCGVYATTSIKVINQYLGTEQVNGAYVRGPVLGIVELGGKVWPATQGFRAEYARVAAIIELDPAYTLPRGRLLHIAAHYHVPLVPDMSKNPEDYREAISGLPPITSESSVGDEAEEFLASLLGGDDDKDEDDDD
jgi:hypothetical protein